MSKLQRTQKREIQCHNGHENKLYFATYITIDTGYPLNYHPPYFFHNISSFKTTMNFCLIVLTCVLSVTALDYYNENDDYSYENVMTCNDGDCRNPACRCACDPLVSGRSKPTPPPISTSTNLCQGTVFENYRKSLIQHCKRSELRLHFECTKVH